MTSCSRDPLRHLVVDVGTRRRRGCKNRVRGGPLRLCGVHARMRFGSDAIRVQKAWRGHRVRGKLRRLYVGLPEELQRRVVFYMREADLLERHHYAPIRIILMQRVRMLQFAFNLRAQTIQRMHHTFALATKYFVLLSERTRHFILSRAWAYLRWETILTNDDTWNAFLETVRRFQVKVALHAGVQVRRRVRASA